MENYPFYPFLSGALGKWGTRKTIFLLINTLGALQFGTQYQEVKPLVWFLSASWRRLLRLGDHCDEN